MKTLYFDCASGISGDMTVAALLDLGADQTVLLDTLGSLPLDHYHLHVGRASKCGIDACDFDVHLDNEPEHHCPDEGHSEHHEHAHPHLHSHEGEVHGHSHVACAHDEEPGHSHAHAHRNLHDCLDILKHGALTPRALELATRIFTMLAQAESHAHGVPAEEVHFHEVGAVDSIVDIAGVAICLDNLGVSRLIFGNIREGQGSVWCQHGRIPVPVPATLHLLSGCKAPFTITDVSGEMITPTGAAVIAALGDSFSPPAAMRVKRIGIGAGKKDFPHANILRVFELLEEPDADRVWLMEANIDDQTGEELGFAMERFLEAGALDCWLEPIYMKKNRPAVKFCVLAKSEDKEAMASLAFTHTSTIGVRWFEAQRTVCEREAASVFTPWGEAKVKRISVNGKTRIAGEYESAKEIALREGLPLRTVMREIEK